MKKIWFYGLLITLISMTCIICSQVIIDDIQEEKIDKSDAKILVSKIELNKSTVSLKEGKTFKVIATVSPENATNKKVTWSSSNRNIATVGTTGIVTAIKAGTCMITATALDGSEKSAGCKVTVTNSNILISKIELNKTTLSLKEGKTFKLVATVTPANSTNKKVTWSSSNRNIATVGTTGIVTAIKAGTCEIIATAQDGSKVSAKCKLTVTSPNIPVSKIELNKTTVSLKEGKTIKLIATITPENATNKKVTWSSSNTNVATVGTTGIVTAIKAGSATITATTKDGNKTAKCNVTVIQPVTKVLLNFESKEIFTGDTLQLNATVLPENASDKSVTWSSDKKSVATVDSKGKVTAIKAGTAKITVKTKDGGLTATCIVKVKDQLSKICIYYKGDYDLHYYNFLEMEKGKNKKLFLESIPEGVSSDDVEWSSSDTNVAIYDNKVGVKAVGHGKAIITATYKYNKTIKDSIEIIVIGDINIYYYDDNGDESYNDLEMLKDEYETLYIGTNPKVISEQSEKVKWTSSNKEVVTVSYGSVEAVGYGTATITAKYGNIKDTIKVTVKDPTKISIYYWGNNGDKSYNDFELLKGKSEALRIESKPKDLHDNDVLWASSNDSVVLVDKYGDVTAVGCGTATITATCKNNKTIKDTIKITVKEVIRSINIYKGYSSNNFEMCKGESEQLDIISIPMGISKSEVEWSSSNEKVVTISEYGYGSIYAVGYGTATITATCKNNKTIKDTIKVTVKDFTNLCIYHDNSSNDFEMFSGQREYLDIESNPVGIYASEVQWTSSNDSVVLVDDYGDVTAVGCGTAIITATYKDNKTIKDTITITVKDPKISIFYYNDDYPFSYKSYNYLEMAKGKTKELELDTIPIWHYKYGITWTSSNEEVVTVGESGWVYAEGCGTATVTAKIGGVKDTIIITVK